MMPLQPSGDVHQQGEAGGVGFGKAVFAKALDLLEDPLGELAAVAAGQHAVHQLALEGLQAAAPLPGGHRPAQLVRLAGGEAGRHHGELDHLLLENGNAQGAFQHPAHGVVGIGDGLFASAAAQVGVNHVALDRPWPHQRHFDHQIVEVLRLQARQHGHLRPRFHLEHAYAVGPLQHGVGGRILRRNVRHAHGGRNQRQRLADGGEHAEAEHVHLEQPQRFEIVFVPLDHGAFRHCRILDWHQFRQWPGGDDEPAHMLRKVAGKPQDFVYQKQELLRRAAAEIHAGFFAATHHFAAVVPPGEGFRQQVHEILAEAQRLADVAHRAARPVGDQRRRQRGAFAPVAAVDVLNHFFAPFVLEIHVDVRRFVALLGNEALEQQMQARRIQLRDAEAVAHRGVGRRAAALAEDALAAGEANDVVDGEEEVFVGEFFDKRQLFLEQLGHLARHALRPAPRRAGGRQLAQIGAGRKPRGHHFGRILVAQFA